MLPGTAFGSCNGMRDQTKSWEVEKTQFYAQMGRLELWASYACQYCTNASVLLVGSKLIECYRASHLLELLGAQRFLQGNTVYLLSMVR